MTTLLTVMGLEAFSLLPWRQRNQDTLRPTMFHLGEEIDSRAKLGLKSCILRKGETGSEGHRQVPDLL